MAPCVFARDLVFHNITTAFRTQNIVIDIVVTAINLSAKTEAFGSVFPFIDHRVMVKDMAIIFAGSNLSAAQTIGRDGRFIFHRPHTFIEAMNVLLNKVITRKPAIIEPVSKLGLHVGPTRLPRSVPKPAHIVIGVHGHNFANFAVMDLSHGGPFSPVVAPAKPETTARFFSWLPRRPLELFGLLMGQPLRVFRRKHAFLFRSHSEFVPPENAEESSKAPHPLRFR